MPPLINPYYEDLSDEERDVLELFAQALLIPTRDGRGKRESGKKVNWKVDPTHKAAAERHRDRYWSGERYDADHDGHAGTAIAWRWLAVALQEGVTREHRKGEGLGQDRVNGIVDPENHTQAAFASSTGNAGTRH